MKFTDAEFDRADSMADRLVPAYEKHSYSCDDAAKEIPMFSYRKAGDWAWTGFVMKLFRAGYDEAQVATILQSKLIRWMFDMSGSERMMEAGSRMAGEFLKANSKASLTSLLAEADPDVVRR